MPQAAKSLRATKAPKAVSTARTPSSTRAKPVKKAAAPAPVKAATRAAPARKTATPAAQLTISSRNYGAWALRGWLLTRLSGLEFSEKIVPPDDPEMKAEMLLLSPSMLVPSLLHDGIKVWDTLAIAEYLNEVRPGAQLLPADAKARAHCRAISGEMHSGFSALRSALPMNIKAHFPKHKVWSRAQADIDRITAIWTECLATYGSPYLFGARPTVADAMYAPVVTRFLTYDVALDKVCAAYCRTIMAMPAMAEWVAAAKLEPDEIDELDAEF